MKKILIVAAAAMVAMAYTSCQKSIKANLKSDVDSVVYNVGVAQSAGLKQYALGQLGIDSAYIDEFIRGMQDGATNTKTDPKKEAFAKGQEIGRQVRQMADGISYDVYVGDTTMKVNVDNLLAGLSDGLRGKSAIAPDSAQRIFPKQLDAVRTAYVEKTYGENRAAGEKFIAEYKTREGAVALESGVVYRILTEGKGKVPSDTSVVKCHYEGKLIDGTVFDSSYERNEPFTVNMRYPQVIPGWIEVLKLMPAGSKWEVVIPSDKAYGTQNRDKIKPFSTLVFTIETL